MQKKRGYTLIEMMLVIAVIAIIASFSLMMYKKYSETARVDKVAIETQHVLEAALAYNVDHQAWPAENNGSDCSTTAPDKNEPFVKNYIPNQNTQSTYGSYFCWDKAGSSAGESKNRLFWVAMKVPGASLTLAKRIAARLPNAITTSELQQTEEQTTAPACTTSSCYVRTEVVQPGASSNTSSGSGSIIASGNCPTTNTNGVNANKNSSTCTLLDDNNESEYEISFNACPSGDVPRTTVFPNFISAPKGSWPGFSFQTINAERVKDSLNHIVPCTTSIVDGIKKQNCDIKVHVTWCEGSGFSDKCHYKDIKKAGGSTGASYMVACIPQTESTQ